MIRISSRQEGFRRAGVKHTKSVQEYDNDRFSKDELKQLRAEPMLTVKVSKDKKDSE